MLAAALLDEVLLALEDRERRARARRLLVPLVADALREVLAGEYVDKHAAEAMGVEWKTVRRELPCFRVGRRVVARRADVVAFVESRSVASPPAERRDGTRVPSTRQRPDETRVSSPPESGDSFEIALQNAEKRRRAGGLRRGG